MDFSEFRTRAISLAEIGCPEELASLIEAGEANTNERKFAAAIIRGEWSRPRGRQPQFPKERVRVALAAFWSDRANPGQKAEARRAQIAAWLGLTDANVKFHLRNSKDCRICRVLVMSRSAVVAALGPDEVKRMRLDDLRGDFAG